MMEIDEIADEVLREGVDDWVPIDVLLWYAQQASHGSQDSFEKLVAMVLEFLLSNGLMLVGEIGDSGFESWNDSPNEAVGRVIRECERVSWKPLGGLFWLSNTRKGTRRVR
jgi:hypothetical protein